MAEDEEEGGEEARRWIEKDRVVWETSGSTEWIDARRFGERVTVTGLGVGDCALHLNVLDEAESVFEVLRDQVEWSEMAHRGGVVPRLVAIQAVMQDDGGVPLYRHPAEEQPWTRDFHPQVAKVASVLEGLGLRPNHCLAQLYRNGLDNISDHADKTLDVRRGTSIANVSLGATRVLTLRHKRLHRTGGVPGEQRTLQKIVLPHNSVFVLGWESNRRLTHAVNRDARPQDLKSPDETSFASMRISLTFRDVATFHHPTSGRLHGQGAPPSSSSPVLDDDVDRETDAMIQAFSLENRDPDFDWDSAYGRGFQVLGFNLLPSGHCAGGGGGAQQQPSPPSSSSS